MWAAQQRQRGRFRGAHQAAAVEVEGGIVEGVREIRVISADTGCGHGLSAAAAQHATAAVAASSDAPLLCACRQGRRSRAAPIRTQDRGHARRDASAP